jgi:hypothetical protein
LLLINEHLFAVCLVFNKTEREIKFS